MIALAVAIGFLVIFLSMYTTVIERTRDIGVLKSMGASNAYIVRALLMETAVICGAGIVAGHRDELPDPRFFPFGPSHAIILITPDWIVRAALIAVAGGLLGASYPAWLASRKDVIEALAYD
jgi:putative ABC transport system permease protein